jgi:hypothetical protein
MTKSIEHPYLSVDMAEVGQIMQKLHDHVVGQRRRVEVTCDGYADSLIMISRAELETLEQALAIFADTAEFNDMCQSLKNLLEKAGVVYSPQICGNAEAAGVFADDRG